MVRKRKSGFLTFCFSLLPGAGEMYLGFMKMGVSLMGLFLGIWMLCSLLNVYTLSFIEVVVWFYSFFHVHNLAGLEDEEFLKVEDEFLFHLDAFADVRKNTGKYKNIIAVILIIAGILLLWNGIKTALMPWIPDGIFRILSRFENTVPRILAGVGIIFGGLRMIRGKEKELKEVIIDVEPEEMKEETVSSNRRENPGMDLAPKFDAERKAYGTETECKNP